MSDRRIDPNDDDAQTRELNRLARVHGGSGGDGDPPGGGGGGDGGGGNGEDQPTLLPEIELPREGRNLTAFAREAGAVCRGAGVFRRDRTAVTINRETGLIEFLEPEAFRTWIEKVAMTYVLRVKENEDGEKLRRKLAKTMTSEVAKATLKCDDFIYQIPRLERVNVVRQPVMREDGRIELLQEGYDAESGVYTMKSKVKIHEDWTLEMARLAWRDLHKEFDFSAIDKGRDCNRDLAVHSAMMANFFGALLLPMTMPRMSVLYNANSHGAGKTLLAKIIIISVMGRCKVRSLPDNKEEFRKMLDTAALAASPYILLDDVAGNLRNNDLNAFMTSSYWSGRTMSTQKEFEVPRQTVVFLTGHNLTMESDLARRALQCKLYVDDADIRDRKVGREIDDQLLAHDQVRSDILTAWWTIIKEWDKAGRPKAKTTIGGFAEWCRVYGGIVEFAGFGDACEKPAADESADTEYEDMVALVTALAKQIDVDQGEKLAEFTFDQVLEEAVVQNCFSWMIEGKWKGGSGPEPRHFETTSKTQATLGRLMSNKYGGRLFTLKDGRKIRFGKRGKNRHRRYQVSIEG